MAKKKKCINCGSKESLTYFQDALPFCRACIEKLDKAVGFPVLEKKHDQCPYCNGYMEEGFVDDLSWFDDQLASEYGVNINDDHDAILIYYYTFDFTSCVNEDCKIYNLLIAHGQRFYWNEHEGDFRGDKPLTPKEIKQKELEALEAAGQQRLL